MNKRFFGFRRLLPFPTFLCLLIECLSKEGTDDPLQYSCLENPRDGSLVGCRLWGHIESDTTEVT